MFKSRTKHPVKLRNPKTMEVWICENFANRRIVDGVEFVEVHKPDNSRMVWINLQTVNKIKNN